jgi:SAM-dependent methyltransferase
MKNTSTEDTPLYGRLLIRFIRPFPNFDFGFIRSVRQKAVRSLNLSPGSSVIDAGCGPGGSFPFLVEAVGPQGKVVGIEISPVHSELARKRIAANGWHNVEVMTVPARKSRLQGQFEGLLMFAAPDVYGSETELANLFTKLGPNARVAAFGGKLASRGVGRALGPVLKALYKLSFSTTPPPALEPSRVLTDRLDDVIIEDYFFGLMFLLSGTVKPSVDADGE